MPLIRFDYWFLFWFTGFSNKYPSCINAILVEHKIELYVLHDGIIVFSTCRNNASLKFKFDIEHIVWLNHHQSDIFVGSQTDNFKRPKFPKLSFFMKTHIVENAFVKHIYGYLFKSKCCYMTFNEICNKKTPKNCSIIIHVCISIYIFKTKILCCVLHRRLYCIYFRPCVSGNSWLF